MRNSLSLICQDLQDEHGVAEGEKAILLAYCFLISCHNVFIVDLMVRELSNRLADQELSLELTDAARTQVIENGYDPVYGARPLKRYLQNYVETLAAKKILSGDVHAGDTLVLDVRDGEFVINTK